MTHQQARQGAGRWLPLSILVSTAILLAVGSAEAAQQTTPARTAVTPSGDGQEAGGGTVQDTASPIGKWTVGGRGLFALPSGDEIEAGGGIGGFAVYRISTDLELEIEADWVRHSIEVGTLPEGDLTIVPIRGSARVQLWRFRGAEPYASGGAGIYLADFSITDSAVQRLEELGFTVSQTLESGVGVHAGGGIEWTRRQFKFGVDVKYVVGTLDSSSRVIDRVTGLTLTDSNDVEIDGLWLSFGVRVEL